MSLVRAGCWAGRYSVWCDDSIALINEEQGGFIAVKGVQLLFAGAAAIQHHVMISADLL